MFASNTDGGDSQLAGKKRTRGNLVANESDDNEEDSLVTDKDMAELGDEEFFYKGKTCAAKDSSVLL